MNEKLKSFMIEELLCQHQCQPVHKDILIVVRDQYQYISQCLDSIFAHTNGFTVYLWDNGSEPETAEYLELMTRWHDNIRLWRVEENEGFLLPNNKLAAETTADYLILLNSDTEVKEGWSEALIGYLQAHEQVAATGYEGYLLSAEGMGVLPWRGREIDYVCGWCLAVPRKAYEQLGLFDSDHLRFAYCEDADYCLRAKEQSWDVYALNLDLVKHHGNITTRAVSKQRKMTKDFIDNHDYLRRRHEEYLRTKRVLLSYPDLEAAINTEDNTPERVAKVFDNC